MSHVSGLRRSKTSHPVIDVRARGKRHFESAYLAFNFSFITGQRKYNFMSNGFTKAVKLRLLEKLIRLSSEQYVHVLGWPRELGLEFIPQDQVRLAVNSAFIKSKRQQDCMDDFLVFRLSKAGRVIGMIQATTFYVLGIDTTFDTYQH